jgi:hypothetical protein
VSKKILNVLYSLNKMMQCWFTGSHSDIGGGWHDHDLSDLTLTWMAVGLIQVQALDNS